MRPRILLLSALLAILPGCDSSTGPARSDAVVWLARTPATLTPAADSAAVYAITTQNDVVSLDRGTGALRWTARAADAELLLGSDLAIAGDVVVVSTDVGLEAFARADGQPAWTFPFTIEVGQSENLLAGDGEAVYLTAGPSVVSVSATTGAARWTVDLSASGSLEANEPEVRDGLLFVGQRTPPYVEPSGGRLLALDAATGAERWSYTFQPGEPGQGAGCCWGGPVFSGSSALVSADDGRIYSFSRSTGAVEWTAPALSVADTSIATSDQRPLAVSGGVVVAGSKSGYLTGYDVATGAQRWQANAGLGAAIARPGSDGTRVYVAFSLPLLDLPVWRPGPLAAFDAATGAGQWRTSFAGFNAPIVGDSVVYAVADLMGVYALRK